MKTPLRLLRSPEVPIQLNKMPPCDNFNRHAPTIPSPLNPKHNNTSRLAGRRCSKPRRRAINLAQRLLRSKAAEAWRDHVLTTQVSQYEEWATLEGCCEPVGLPATTERCRPIRGADEQQEQSAKGDSSCVGLGRSLLRCIEKGQQFAMPDMSVLVTRRTILAMGLVGVLPALRLQGYLRPVVRS